MVEAIPAHANPGAAFAASDVLENDVLENDLLDDNLLGKDLVENDVIEQPVGVNDTVVSDSVAHDNVLFSDHVGLVHRVARRYVGLGIEYDDLVQAGMLGVLRAMKTFDPGRGRFSTYATPWIRQSIVREIQNNSRTIRVPVHQQFSLYRAGQLTTERLARLDAPLSDGDSTLHDFLGKMDDPTDRLARSEAQQHIAAAITELSDKQRAVVEWRFGEEELTLSEIGSRLGVSRARARQIEESALRALQREIKTQGVPDPSDDCSEEPESSYWPQYRGE